MIVNSKRGDNFLDKYRSYKDIGLRPTEILIPSLKNHLSEQNERRLGDGVNHNQSSSENQCEKGPTWSLQGR